MKGYIKKKTRLKKDITKNKTEEEKFLKKTKKKGKRR